MGNCFKKSERSKEDGAPPPTDKEDDSSFALQLMKAQNEYRLKHGAEPLTLDQDMCKEAQRWADELGRSNKLQHADTDDGENLAFAGPTLSAKQAADMWYNEIKDYSFSRPGFTGGTDVIPRCVGGVTNDHVITAHLGFETIALPIHLRSHFTQLVWVGSKQFGAAVAKGSGGMFAVGRYRPAGNITNAGQFEANVLPAK